MCGIAGIFALKDAGRRWPLERTGAMVKALSHRGPDGSGMFIEPGIFLGHTRLAVLDLSPAGRQPMASPDGNLVITFNGEIYNFRELRNELEPKGHRFQTGTDTEVILAAWEQWGAACVDRLDGIFAFAVYDREKRSVTLVRDHLGVKPLFYRVDNGELTFASEPLALFGPLSPAPPIDPTDLDVYFTYNYLPAPRTGLRGVYQLQQGHMLLADEHGESLRCYWHPSYDDALLQWGDGLVANFARILSESVTAQMVSDAPLGLFLSGGLDSYSVALSAVSSGANPTAFTLGFDSRNYDERPAAAEYAAHLGIADDAVEFAWNADEIQETLAAMGELLADASCFPIYQLSRHARKSATVILAGDGGDELLAGYDTYRAGELTHIVRLLPGFVRNALRQAARLLPSDNERYGWRMVAERFISSAEAGHGRDHASFRRIFSDGLKQSLYEPDFYTIAKGCDPVGEYARHVNEVPSGRSYLTARQHADLVFHLPSILAKVDRMSMAHGLEVRVPLLGRKMVDFCLCLPDEAKRSGSKGKRILREAVAGKIPSHALTRRKAGFLPPVDGWFRGDGPMSEVFCDYLERARVVGLPFIRWNSVEKLWQDHRRCRVDAGFALLGVLQYINWSLKCRN